MQAMGLMPISSMTTPPSHPARPVRNTTVPKTPPSSAPAELPYTAAPMMIGARASVIGNGPKRTKLLRTCSTTMMDANRARPVCLRSPLRGVALLILNSFLLSLRSWRMRRSLIIYTYACSVNLYIKQCTAENRRAFVSQEITGAFGSGTITVSLTVTSAVLSPVLSASTIFSGAYCRSRFTFSGSL